MEPQAQRHSGQAVPKVGNQGAPYPPTDAITSYESRSAHNRAAFSHGVRTASQITAMQSTAVMASPIQVESSQGKPRPDFSNLPG
jgi:hypothetical protein